MKFSVSQEKLSKALASCGRVASSRAGLPILETILLRCTKTELVVASTNLELASTTRIGVKVDDIGEVAIPAKLINEVVSTLPKGVVEVSLEQNAKLHLSSGSYTVTVNGMKTDDFPELPTINEKSAVQYEINAIEFKQTVSQTIFVASKDQTRPVLTGVYWHSFDGTLFAASSDGYRLAEKKIIPTSSEIAAIIPNTSLGEATRLLSDDINEVTLLFDTDQVRIRIGETELTSRLIEGKYPNYRELIPASTETKISVDTEPLIRTAKLAGLFSRDTGGSITLQSNEKEKTLTITSTASETGENTTVLSANVTGDGQVSLNSRYLLEVLSVTNQNQVKIGYNGKLSPIIMTSAEKTPDYTHIIMPLKS